MTELKCVVQQYAWGKLGTKSLAAKFAARGRPDDFCINGTDPYAELWMGTHPNGPSMLKGSMTSLFAHKVAQPTKWRFLPKNLSQLVIFVIEIAFT